MLNDLITQNIFLLEQGLEILESFPEALYRLSNEETHGASPGGHFRHILQHYEALLRDMPGKVIDYDQRDRTSKIETDAREARAAIQKILLYLRALPGIDREMAIIQNRQPGAAQPAVQSTLARELTFLISHTVHHFALIAVAMRLNGIKVPRYFGYAPSTIYFLEGDARKTG